MENYEIGTVFDLYDEDSQRYIIINKIENDTELYLLVAPIFEEKGAVKAMYEETFVLSIDKSTDELKYVEDQEVIENVLVRISESLKL